ncbi:hypothetical protein SUGI_1115220 [Cryptomeria japonica]|nr:hypothetical protein SUGI_1115220 [Cryptomeria japonica]
MGEQKLQRIAKGICKVGRVSTSSLLLDRRFPQMEDGAMACLERLEIVNCRKFNKVGEGWERLKRLKEFNFKDSGTNESRETLKEGGVYWTKVKEINPHITIISHSY